MGITSDSIYASWADKESINIMENLGILTVDYELVGMKNHGGFDFTEDFKRIMLMADHKLPNKILYRYYTDRYSREQMNKKIYERGITVGEIVLLEWFRRIGKSDPLSRKEYLGVIKFIGQMYRETRIQEGKKK